MINAAFPVIRSDGTVLWEDGMDATVKVATPAQMCQAKAAGATILMTNQSEFDNAASKIRMLAARRPGEPHPLDVGRDAVQRYFKVFDECAQVARLKLLK